MMMNFYDSSTAIFLLLSICTVFVTMRTTVVHGFVEPPRSTLTTTRTSGTKDHFSTMTTTVSITSETFNFIHALKASENKNDDFFPETSFGAEMVPEGQRPVNEYLDMKRAPLFDWASNEVGTDGLLMRLVFIYVVVFASV
jgi:hypothetical protein